MLLTSRNRNDDCEVEGKWPQGALECRFSLRRISSLPLCTKCTNRFPVITLQDTMKPNDYLFYGVLHQLSRITKGPFDFASPAMVQK